MIENFEQYNRSIFNTEENKLKINRKEHFVDVIRAIQREKNFEKFFTIDFLISQYSNHYLPVNRPSFATVAQPKNHIPLAHTLTQNCMAAFIRIACKFG